MGLSLAQTPATPWAKQYVRVLSGDEGGYMTYTFLTNLLRALIILGVASSLAFAANGQGTRAAKPQETGESQAITPSAPGKTSAAEMHSGESTAANSIIVRTSIGATMELSAPLEISCERLSALEKTGQGKPAEVISGTSGDSGTTGSGRTTPGKADHAEASQVAIPSHGRILTLKTAEGKMTVSCDAASSQGEMPPPQQSGARQSSGAQ
jgi:hypothetical protein